MKNKKIKIIKNKNIIKNLMSCSYIPDKSDISVHFQIALFHI